MIPWLILHKKGPLYNYPYGKPFSNKSGLNEILRIRLLNAHYLFFKVGVCHSVTEMAEYTSQEYLDMIICYGMIS